MKQNETTTALVTSGKRNNADRKAYMVGGGIGSLAAAAFMIRDGGMHGRNITIFEALPSLKLTRIHRGRGSFGIPVARSRR